MSLPAGPYLPTSPVVAVAWLRSRAGIVAGQVATKLPRELATWAELGFVQATIVPGSVDDDLRIRRPLVQVDAWAHSPEGVRPPVGKAARLAELVLKATETSEQEYGRAIDLGPNYLPARVLAAHSPTEPSEVEGDPSGFARVTFDFVLNWVRN